MRHSGTVGHDCLGRFAADDDSWTYEDFRRGGCLSGTGDPLTHLSQIHADLRQAYPQAGMIGYIAYEYGYRGLELTPPSFGRDSFRYPLVQFLLFGELRPAPSRQREFPDRMTASRCDRSPDGSMLAAGLTAHTHRDDYRLHVGRILEHIAAGDIYQANYTQAFDIETPHAPTEVYEITARENPAPFSCFLQFPESRNYPAMTVMSASPERFFAKRGSGVETRPIKGTIARVADDAEDRQRRRILLQSEKDRAELLMITDLERNDLGKIAQFGSVRTIALARLRCAPSVWHLESTITARLDEAVDWTGIMRAMFPGGSITGAPKRRAAEILRDLEPCPRGVYCGCVGWVDARGDADFALAIRTAVQIGSTVRVCGGGGIVADSDPESEYAESLVKIAPILNALTNRGTSVPHRQPEPVGVETTSPYAA